MSKSVDPDQLVLEKLADLDLHCLQKGLGERYRAIMAHLLL